MTKESANKLLSSYGSNPYGKSIFRIVWSDDEYEVRKGTFEEHVGKIYLRTMVAIERVKKYPYLKGMWIFEKWFRPEGISDLPDNVNGSYECIYIFQDKNGSYLPLDVEIAQFIANAISKNVDKSKNKLLIEEMLSDKEKKIEDEDIALIEECSPLIATKLHIGEAVSFAGIEKMEEK